MKSASARTSLAPGPRNTGKPEPVSLAPAGRSRMPERGGELPVRLGLEVERRRLAPACGRSGWPRRRRRAMPSAGKLGSDSACRSRSASISRRRRVERLHLLARRLELRHQLVGRLLGPLAPRDFVAGRVPLGLERLDPHQQVAALAVELEQRVHRARHRRIAAAEQAGAAALGILAQALEVDHGRVSGRGGRARGRGSRN